MLPYVQVVMLAFAQAPMLPFAQAPVLPCTQWQASTLPCTISYLYRLYLVAGIIRHGCEQPCTRYRRSVSISRVHGMLLPNLHTSRIDDEVPHACSVASSTPSRLRTQVEGVGFRVCALKASESF